MKRLTKKRRIRLLCFPSLCAFGCLLQISFSSVTTSAAREVEPASVIQASAPALAPAADSSIWERVGEEDGVEVFKKEIPGSPIIAFKGKTTIDSSIVKVATALLDEKRAMEWMDRLVEIKRLRHLKEGEAIDYTHISTPIVMKDREFVVHNQVEVDAKMKTLTLKVKSVEDPLAPHTSYVRGEIMNSSFTLRPISGGKRTLVISEFYADPKGEVAKWLVNLFQKEWPHKTLTGLKQQVAKPDIIESEYCKKVLKDF